MPTSRNRILITSALCLLPLAAMAQNQKPQDPKTMGGTTERYSAPTDQPVGPSPANPQQTNPQTAPGQASELGTPASPSTTPGQMPSTANENVPGRAVAERLLNQPIKDVEGSNVGRISAVALDQQGRINTVIVAVGGFFGIGARDVMLTWRDLKSGAPSSNDILVAMSKDELKRLPRYEFKDSNQRGTVFESSTS